MERNRVLEKESAAEKANAQRTRRDLDRSADNQKRQIARELERKDRETKEVVQRNKKEYERELKTLTSELNRVRKLKQKLDSDISQLRLKHS